MFQVKARISSETAQKAGKTLGWDKAKTLATLTSVLELAK